MFGVISACVVKGQLVLMTIGGQPVQEKNNLVVRQSQVEYASVNRVKEKTPFHFRKDSRRKKNCSAKRNHNKWKELKRKRMI